MQIVVDKASVEFKIYDASNISLKNIVVRKVGGLVSSQPGAKATIVKALDGVSVEMHDGDRVALLGNNGSGKTTLLRMLAGIYRPTQGSIRIEGKTMPLFDLGLGVDPDATGYENIYLRGLYFGLSRREMEGRTEEIATFSELGPYLHLPVRTYSSGMTLRLLFSVAVSIKADILLLDEWLAVGDANFIERANTKLFSVVDSSRILVLASHSTRLLQRICNKALLLDGGRVIEYGDIDDVLFSYHRRSRAALGVMIAPDAPNPFKIGRAAGFDEDVGSLPRAADPAGDILPVPTAARRTAPIASE